MTMPKEIRNQPQDGNKEDGADFSKFPHASIEQKWAHRWVDDQLYKARDDSSKPPYMVLDMYPYPSGAGLHVGHVEGYTATDIISRYKRMNGFEVLHPMGWDAFGLPTENYAIKTGKDPHRVTEDNAKVFRNQCISAGFSIDWSREIDTSKSEYYKWTQFIFLSLYEQKLAYKAASPVNWCTGCKTVIANEQVIDGHCERCDSSVESRKIEQWFLKITDYADRLLHDLDKLDWPESTKERQKNWIGKTEGFEVQLQAADTKEGLTVFTTEPESLGSADLVVVAPEYPSVDSLVTKERRKDVDNYITSIPPQLELDRKKKKGKKGVFTGKYAVNPLTGRSMEIWISDYVLMDEYGGIRMEQSTNTQGGRTVYEDRKSVLRQLGKLAIPAVRYKLHDWLVSRERYWGAPIPIVHCEKCGDQPVPYSQLPVALPHLEDFTPTGVPPLAKSKEFLHTKCPHCGGKAQRETKTLDTFVDSAWYFLRFADPHNQHALGDRRLINQWLPVDYYMGGSDHATGHLLYARFITKVLSDLGYLDFDEPFTKVMHQGMILGGDGRKMSKRWGNAVNPLDVSDAYGSDAMRLFEMFLGPLEQSKVWDTQAITGTRRFIDKVWRLQQLVHEDNGRQADMQAINTLIKNITSGIETNRFNVDVSEFMKYLNIIERSGRIDRQSYEIFLTLLAPFAPFITEELWERLGNKYSIHQQAWPSSVYQEKTRRNIQLPVTINSKYLGTLEIEEGAGATEQEIYERLLTDPRFAEKLGKLNAKKIIYKQGKIFNILT